MVHYHRRSRKFQRSRPRVIRVSTPRTGPSADQVRELGEVLEQILHYEAGQGRVKLVSPAAEKAGDIYLAMGLKQEAARCYTIALNAENAYMHWVIGVENRGIGQEAKARVEAMARKLKSVYQE